MKTDLRQHMAMIEQLTGACFYNNGLPVHILKTIQAPHTLTTALRLYAPTVANLAKAGRLALAIEAAIQDGPVRVYTERGVVFVEAPSPEPATVRGATLHGQALAVPLGLTSRNQIAGIDFAAMPHLLIVGPTGRGKTTAARAVAFHLAQQNAAATLRFIVTTFKPRDWAAFAPLAYTQAVISDPQEAANCIAWLKLTMHKRAASGQERPAIFVFVDDLLNLLGAVKGELAADLAELASLGRAAGIHLVIMTQRLGRRGAGDAAVTGNMPARLVFGTADGQDAAFFTGRGGSGAERLGRYPGDALLIDDGGTLRLAVAYVGDQDLAQLPQNGLAWRPWQRPTAPTYTSAPAPVLVAAGPITRVSQSTLVGAPVQTGPPALLSPPAALATPLPRRAPNTAERQLLRALYIRLGSKNRTLQAAYGVKNALTLAWLDQALREEEADS